MKQVYIEYIIKALLQLICMGFCYLTNWFVVLFCDKNGELPKIFKLWQTWDDSCDNSTYVLQEVPKWLSYNFYDYYIDTVIPLPKYGRTRYGVINIKELPFKDKIKRYFCRVMWLNRNCGYGFAFYLFGKDINVDNMVIMEYKDYYVGYELGKSFVSKGMIPFHGLYLNIFLGWKVSRSIHNTCRCMIANRIAIRLNNKK